MNNPRDTTSPASIVFVAAYPGPIYCYFKKDRPVEERLPLSSNSSIFIAQESGLIFISDGVNILQEDVDESIRQRKLKHPMIPGGCSEKCKRQCRTFSVEERRYLWNQYWDMTLKLRHQFLHKHILITNVKRRTSNQGNTFAKNESRTFSLPKNGEFYPVCKSFFLKTLGYRTDGVITEISKSIKRKQLFPTEDDLGIKKAKKPTLNRDLIEGHILSYNPAVSHCRPHNAPLMRYLPRSLTVTAMYKDFLLRNPTFKCSIEIYRQQLKEMNISLHSPKSDRCVDCLLFEEESKKYQTHESVPEEVYLKFEEHRTKAETATNHYKLDSLKSNTGVLKYYSVDLQKVILLPDMPQVKESFFLSRLICFNMTFSPVHTSDLSLSYCMLWHEAQAGRNANNIVDAFVSLIQTERDVVNFNFWAYNCTAQNKNWPLYAAMVVLVNSRKWQAETITIKYVAKGHTHMSSDSVHDNIESRMRREKAMYDFNDFKTLVASSSKNLRVVEVAEFREWPKEKREESKMDPIRLSSVVEVKFVRGCTNLLFKEKFENEFSELDFLFKKFNLNTISPTIITHSRGIKKEKKDKIVSTLVPLMPENRKSFWINLPVNDISCDLTFEEQMTVEI